MQTGQPSIADLQAQGYVPTLNNCFAGEFCYIRTVRTPAGPATRTYTFASNDLAAQAYGTGANTPAGQQQVPPAVASAPPPAVSVPATAPPVATAPAAAPSVPAPGYPGPHGEFIYHPPKKLSTGAMVGIGVGVAAVVGVGVYVATRGGK